MIYSPHLVPQQCDCEGLYWEGGPVVSPVTGGGVEGGKEQKGQEKIKDEGDREGRREREERKGDLGKEIEA